jgi:copper chaperone CopZ
MRGMRSRTAAATLALLVLILAPAAVRAGEALRFTVVGIDCEECAAPIVRALRGVPGVTDARLDWKTAVGTVQTGPGFDRESLRRALQEIGYEAVFEGEQRRDLQPLPDEVRRTLDIASASDGEKLDLPKALVPGKITVVDYWAEWCSPCHLLDTRLQHLVHSDPGLAVRRVNMGKWDNPAARQATSSFSIEALPYVRVYDANGKFVGDATGGVWDKLLKLVEKARARGGAAS